MTWKTLWNLWRPGILFCIDLFNGDQVSYMLKASQLWRNSADLGKCEKLDTTEVT